MFQFQEVVVDPKERARIQKGPVASQLFQFESSERLEVTEYRLRELSVRLRTINNACDSMASLPDGLPITEVSMYGSVVRQYVLGPYDAVKRLISGELPSLGTLLPDLNNSRNLLNTTVKSIEGYLDRLRTEERIQRIYLSPIPNVSRINSIAIQWPMVQLWREDIEHLEASLTGLNALIPELIPNTTEIESWKHWWMPWTEDIQGIRNRWEEHVQVVVGKADAIMSRLQEQVFAPG